MWRCRSDWPGLCLFCCYRVLSDSRVDFWAFFFCFIIFQFYSPPPPDFSVWFALCCRRGFPLWISPGYHSHHDVYRVWRTEYRFFFFLLLLFYFYFILFYFFGGGRGILMLDYYIIRASLRSEKDRLNIDIYWVYRETVFFKTVGKPYPP